jgi:hypothetical protein
MKQARIIVALALTLSFLITGCSEDSPTSTPGAKELVAAQDYYPTEYGSTWLYRYDTTGADGITVKDAYRRRSTIQGDFRFDLQSYFIQLNETIRSTGTSLDTAFVRKDDKGLFASSFFLQGASLFPEIPLFEITIPTELQLMPYPPSRGGTWDLFTFEFDIAIFSFYFRATATYMGIESVATDMIEYEDCVRIQIKVEARLPNLEDPTDILNPTEIDQEGNFWFSNPIGLVVGEGSQTIFDLLDGILPNILGIESLQIRQELIEMEIVQPDGVCIFRNTKN